MIDASIVYCLTRDRELAAAIDDGMADGAEVLVAAEAGGGVTLLPAERGACVRDVIGLARG
ncbi:MAG: hypothetical protein ABI841_08140 [Chloroflexota bacterium]